MAEVNEILTSPCRRRVEQSISVPFLWEEMPGTPKREWPMTQLTPSIIAPSPSRLVVSIPIPWKEPGKPNPTANHFAQKDEASSEDGSKYYEDWYSSLSETDGNGSSSHSATHRNDSIDDTPIIEFFCPLPLPPNAEFVEKVLQESDAKKSWREEHGLKVKQTSTLGELILLSCKLSYGRKTVGMKKKKRFSMEFIKESLPACFSLKTANHQNNVPITSIYRSKVKSMLSPTS